MYNVEKDIRGVDYTVPLIVNNAVEIAQAYEDVIGSSRGYTDDEINPEFLIFLYTMGISEDEKEDLLKSNHCRSKYVKYMESLLKEIESGKKDIELDYGILRNLNTYIRIEYILNKYLEQELKNLFGSKSFKSTMYLDFCEIDRTCEMLYFVSVIYTNENNEIQDYSGTEEVYFRAR